MTCSVRVWLLLLCAGVLGAQQSPDGGGELSLNLDVRNRFVQDVSGNGQVYRSIVNLGEGPRLFGGDMRYTNPSGALFDEFSVDANSWGGDPYNTARIRVGLRDVYDLTVNYRNVAYFNNLPSFANPLLGEGLLLSQRVLDITRRQFETDLVVKPNSTISPFFSFYKADGFGLGTTTFLTDGDEFPVGTDLDDDLTSFRGGVKINFSKYNFTLEQGATTFSDDQEIFFRDGVNPGNVRRTFFGRDIVLNKLLQSYRAEGDGLFNRGVVQGRPATWLNFTGQFLYSKPSIDVRQELTATGSFFSQTLIAPFTGQFEQNLADANRPHSSGSWTTELRPYDRLRIIQSWYTDRFHVSSGSTLVQMLNTRSEAELEDVAIRTLIFNYNQHQVDVIFEAHPRVTLRGGHRYVWGDTVVPEASLSFRPEPGNEGEVRRHVGLAGLSLRAASRLTFSMDFEASPGDRTFFRTGLMDYWKTKARVRYKLSPSLNVAGSFAILDNRNPAQDIDFDFQSRQSSVSVYWTPDNGERFSLLADYTRSTLRSDIEVVELPFFGQEFSRYRDNGHHAGLYGDIQAGRARLTLGGSLSVNSGSRPTRFYVPRAAIVVPMVDRVKWVAEWRWYGFGGRVLSLRRLPGAHLLDRASDRPVVSLREIERVSLFRDDDIQFEQIVDRCRQCFRLMALAMDEEDSLELGDEWFQPQQ